MNKKIILLFLLFFAILVVFLIIGSNYEASVKSNKIQVTASFYPFYFFAQQIAGNRADVINITPAGSEPHDYDLTVQDIIEIEQSRMLVTDGYIEPWLKNISKNIDNKNTLIVEVSKEIDDLIYEEQDQGKIDSHIWLDPSLSKKIVDVLEDAFLKIDPLNEDYYQSNAQSLKDKLTKLDDEYKTSLGNCGQNSFVTSHDAFGYLAAAYRLNQISISR